MFTDILEIIRYVLNRNYDAVFLDSLISDGNAYVFSKSAVSLSAVASDFNSSLASLDNLCDSFNYGFGYISYEAGKVINRKHFDTVKFTDEQILNFKFYNNDNVRVIPLSKISKSGLSDLISGNVTNVTSELAVSEEKYKRDIERIKDFIANGETYQVNYTSEFKFEFDGNVLNLIATLLFKQSADYTAIINNGDSFILSFSPEMFFKIERNIITVKPMKGTINRGHNLFSDGISLSLLQQSPKDKAENVMIVDLLRNDIGRICKFGSVCVNSLFGIEKYESLYQMVTTISGELIDDIKLSDVLENLFPCGSITGAPKIRTMQIIDEIEGFSRGLYTGSIGLITPQKVTFSVAIRTLELEKSGNKFNGRVGTGSGITWKSDASSEYSEVLLKTKFITTATPYFSLFETMTVEDGSIFLFKEHITRLGQAASYFLFKFDENNIKKMLFKEANCFSGKIKLVLDKWGNIKIEKSKNPPLKDLIKVKVSSQTMDSHDRFRYFKTTNRAEYNLELEKAIEEGFDEILFYNERGEITEGAISNIFYKKKGIWFTPKVSSGLLAGTYRQFFIEKNSAVETLTYLEDIKSADKIMFVNSVRREMDVKLLA